MELVANTSSKVANCNLRVALALRNQRIQRRVFGEMLLLSEFGEPEVEDGAFSHDVAENVLLLFFVQAVGKIELSPSRRIGRLKRGLDSSFVSRNHFA